MTTLSDRRFSQRVGRAVGGNADSGPFQGVPFQMMHPNYVMYWNDFITPKDYDPGVEWTETDRTPVGAGTVAFATNTGTELILTAGAEVNEGIQTQHTGSAGGEFVNMSQATGHFAMGCRIKKAAASISHAAVGFAETDATLQSTTGGVTVSSGLMFDYSEAVFRVVGSGGTVTLDLLPSDVGDDIYVELGLSIRRPRATAGATGEVAIWYRLNGQSTWKKEVAASRTLSADVNFVPLNNLCPSMGEMNSTPGGGILTIDYLWAISERVATT